MGCSLVLDLENVAVVEQFLFIWARTLGLANQMCVHTLENDKMTHEVGTLVVCWA